MNSRWRCEKEWKWVWKIWRLYWTQRTVSINSSPFNERYSDIIQVQGVLVISRGLKIRHCIIFLHHHPFKFTEFFSVLFCGWYFVNMFFYCSFHDFNFTLEKGKCFWSKLYFFVRQGSLPQRPLRTHWLQLLCLCWSTLTLQCYASTI